MPGRSEHQAAGQLLECQAVQGLCQLLEHHVAVLEQSQEPMGKLLEPGATQDSECMCNCSIAILPAPYQQHALLWQPMASGSTFLHEQAVKEGLP